LAINYNRFPAILSNTIGLSIGNRLVINRCQA